MESSNQVKFKVLEQDESSLSWVTIFNKTEQRLDYVMAVNKTGLYLFTIDSSCFTSVTLDIEPVSQIASNVGFIITSCTSAIHGGAVCAVTVSRHQLTSSFSIGKTWESDTEWIRHSKSFTAQLRKNEVIRIKYNSSAPVSLLYKGSNGLTNIVTSMNYSKQYTIPFDDEYVFDFDLIETETAHISFSCVYLERFTPSSNNVAEFYHYL